MPPSYDIIEWVCKSSLNMLSKHKNILEKNLSGVARHLHWVNPNLLTLIGIIPQVAFFFLMRSHFYGWAALALALSIFDVLDGVVARASGRVTAFGAFLDSTFDRIADFLIIWAFYVAGLVPLNLIIILL